MLAEAVQRAGVAVVLHRARSRLRPAIASLPALALALVLALPVAVLPVGASAATTERFRVSLPVADQSAAARRAGAQEALATVFVRVTGRESVLAVPALRAALRQAQRFYSTSGYERRDARERLLDPEDRPWLLVLEFDERSVVDLLAEHDIPVWTTRRPEILVWMLAEDAGGARRLLGATDPEGAALLARARRRGLDVFLPAIDLTDLATFPMADAWAGYGDMIERASRRYGSEAFLTLRLFPDPLGRWIADWRGEVAGQPLDGALEVEDPVAGAAGMLDAVADTLADRYAISLQVASGGESLWLQVDRVRDLEHYASLMRYLESTSGVAAVQLVQMQGSSLLLRLDIADASARLLDLMRLEDRLIPEAAPDRAGGIPVWRARWRGADAER